MASRITRLFISLIVATGDSITRLFRGSQTPGTCVVINYHSILDESREQFAKQLDLLPHLAKPIFAAKPFELRRGTRHVAVTVDDLFVSFVQNGLPELCRRKIPVTLFVPTDYLGRKSAWEDYGGENKVGEAVASAEEVKRMAAFETVDFGSHGASHPDFTRLSEADARHELTASKETLEKIIGRPITTLSFPYGSHTERDLRLAEETGYRFCFDSREDSVLGAMKGGLIGRVDVQPSDWDIEFRLKVTGAYRWVRRAGAWKRKIIKR